MKEVIETAIKEALVVLGLPEVSFNVEHPADLSFGDLATNVALVAAKVAGENPKAMAEKIATQLEGQIEYVEKIEVAGPGFINFYLARDFFVGELNRISELKEKWGRSDRLAGQTILVEYTDPNPFKEFHVGHLFTNAVGESIARLFMSQGADVRRVNYQGDVGLHVACAIYGMSEMGLTPQSDFSAKDLGKAYAIGATANKENETAREKIRQINKAVYEKSDEAINALYSKGREVSLNYFESIYQILDTKFDHYFFESEVAGPGKDIVVNNPEVFPESDGARVFKGEDYGLHTRVFLNKDGLPTYEAKELALAKQKYDYAPYDHSVVSTAKEINEYFKVLLTAMSKVYPDLAQKTEHVGHGMVRLSTGKMSSRTGDVIAATDFIEEIASAASAKLAESSMASEASLSQEIAIGAIKYATLKGSIYQDTVFNKEQALSFEGASGPYLQYTHARINSVLEKAASVGVEPSTSRVPTEAYAVEKILYRFPEVVELALSERAPHHVVTFLTELASNFNSFYATEVIASKEDEYAPYKAAVAEAVKTTLKNGLWVLGIKAPERM